MCIYVIYVHLYIIVKSKKNICTSYKNGPEKRAIVEFFWSVSRPVQSNLYFISIMYVSCVYSAMSKGPRQLPNCLKREKKPTSEVPIVFNGVLYHVRAYTVTISQIESCSAG